MITLAHHDKVQLCVSRRRLIHALATHRKLPNVGGIWEHIWGVQDAFVVLRPWLDFNLGAKLNLRVGGERRTLSLRTPLTREQERAFRRAADASGIWFLAKVIGHTFPLTEPPPWLAPLLTDLTEQVHASILQLAAKDPRITAALT